MHALAATCLEDGMSENERPLKWLRKQGDEWKWAADYLKQKLDAGYMGNLEGNAATRFATYENVVTAIRQVQRDRLDLVIKLQSAIRQRRYRSGSNGRKPRTFTLTKEAITSLGSIAKRLKADETSVVTALIETEEKAVEAERNYENQLKESIRLERRIGAMSVASMKAQRDEALKYAERYLKLLALWELAHPGETPPAASDEKTSQFVQTKMKDLNDAMAYVSFREDVLNERAT